VGSLKSNGLNLISYSVKEGLCGVLFMVVREIEVSPISFSLAVRNINKDSTVLGGGIIGA
jgi:hypothetical protein